MLSLNLSLQKKKKKRKIRKIKQLESTILNSDIAYFQCNWFSGWSVPNSQTITAYIDKNLLSCEYQSNSTIQETSKRIESRRDEISRSGRWKNIQQKKNYKNYKISSVMEGVYSRVQSIEKKRKFGECKKGSSKI